MKIFCSALFLSLIVSTGVFAQKLKAEEVIAKHLDSVAPTAQRPNLKTLVAVGDVRVDYLTKKSHPASGRIVLASDGSKAFLGMSLNASDYPQEKMIFDGKKSNVDYVRPGNRSPLGTFVDSHNELLKDGLLGGTLTTSWAMHHMLSNKAKVSYSGLTKVDGVEAHELKFTPKGGGDLNIVLYFDAQDFRHIRTEYSRISSAPMGRTIDESVRQTETRMKVVELFSDHKAYDGVTVPTKYKLTYTITSARGSDEVSYTADFLEFAVNQNLDPGTFAIVAR
ncbi:MAG TPA: hypothetical protein VFZ49_03430 [Pyrinomonadaceae bacterium]